MDIIITWLYSFSPSLLNICNLYYTFISIVYVLLSLCQRKTHAVVENLLKSEAAFLTSLNIATKASGWVFPPRDSPCLYAPPSRSLTVAIHPCTQLPGGCLLWPLLILGWWEGERIDGHTHPQWSLKSCLDVNGAGQHQPSWLSTVTGCHNIITLSISFSLGRYGLGSWTNSESTKHCSTNTPDVEPQQFQNSTLCTFSQQ